MSFATGKPKSHLMRAAETGATVGSPLALLAHGPMHLRTACLLHRAGTDSNDTSLRFATMSPPSDLIAKKLWAQGPLADPKAKAGCRPGPT